MERALEGIRVLDLSHVLAAPTATMILGDLGAEVIHIESPSGDEARDYGPFIGSMDKNHSAYFISLNRNKKSIVLDLKQDKAKNILRDLINVSDVFVENYRPGTMKALGFGWEDVQRMNSKMIYASISGFGHDTIEEYSSRPAYDIVVQAYSGLMSITGPEGGQPCRVGSSIGDIIAGHQAAIGILAALNYRTRTGRGQFYDGSMVDGLFATLENAIVRYTVEGKIPQPLGTAHPSITPFQALRTKDGWLVITIGSEKLWLDFCMAINRKDLSQHPKFKTNYLRMQNKGELISLIEGEMQKKTTGEWENIFSEAEVPYSRINNIKEICEDPQIQHRQMLVEIEQKEAGKMKIAGSPLHLSETPGRVYAGAPLFGEHTDEILTTILKLSPQEILNLKNDGAINK